MLPAKKLLDALFCYINNKSAEFTLAAIPHSRIAYFRVATRRLADIMYTDDDDR